MDGKKAIEEEQRRFAAMLAFFQQAWVESVIGSLSEEEVLAVWRQCQQRKERDARETLAGRDGDIE